MWGAAAIAVLAAAINCRKRLSANALDWDVFGAVFFAVVPLLSRKSLSFLESFSFAPFVCSLVAFLLRIRWIIASDLMMAFAASIFFEMICTSVYPVHASTSI
eukprot:Plantae.Rhodophyta-Palmaria_palmata.ctg2877.p3 GENE.Plantae.Rhodophyta-Palmaria_palmata.ctg2877~~Plantae.Rhodophyta-Palmaria_palmata.ctg2877.p3  ORF type:complete len:103 (-),score=10.37 Plantae.Rhodophyta-Palmaria_palmata.ctg2877:519-827(-)